MNNSGLDRYQGRCKRFGSHKKYGFIVPLHGNGEIFVHQNNIHSNAVKCLNVGELVEFSIVTMANGKQKAINVTGPNGSYVKGAYTHKTLHHEIHVLCTRLDKVERDNNKLNQKNKSLLKKMDQLSRNQMPQLDQLSRKKWIKAPDGQRNKKYEEQIQIIASQTQDIKQLKFQNIKYKKAMEKLSDLNASLLSQQQLYINKIYKLQDEQKEMELKYAEMKERYLKHKKQIDYNVWDGKDIADWIINLNKSRYNKYYKMLYTNIQTEGIDGSCLDCLDKSDLHRLGITNFKDKRDVYKQIQLLVGQNQNKPAQNDTVNKQIEGLGTTLYI